MFNALPTDTLQKISNILHDEQHKCFCSCLQARANTRMGKHRKRVKYKGRKVKTQIFIRFHHKYFLIFHVETYMTRDRRTKTERQRDTHIHRRQRQIQRDGQTGRQTNRPTDGRTETHRLTDRQTGTQIGKQQTLKQPCSRFLHNKRLISSACFLKRLICTSRFYITQQTRQTNAKRLPDQPASTNIKQRIAGNTILAVICTTCCFDNTHACLKFYQSKQ